MTITPGIIINAIGENKMTTKKSAYYKKVQTTIQAVIDVFMEKVLKWGLSFVVLIFLISVVDADKTDPEKTIEILVVLVIGGWVAGLMAGLLENIDEKEKE